MASMAGSIISGVLQGTGGAGSEFAPAVKDKVDTLVSPKPETPEVKNADVKEAAKQTTAPQTNWSELATRANQMQKTKG